MGSNFPKIQFLETIGVTASFRPILDRSCSLSSSHALSWNLSSHHQHNQAVAVTEIYCHHAGLNHIDMQECRRRGISIANAGSLFSEEVADLAIGLLIDVLRKILAADRYVRQGLWANKGGFHLGSKLGGKKVGIVGLGSIGQEVAARLEAFGCNISYNSRNNKSSVTYPYYSDVCELASNCEILIICCELSDQTRGMINKEVLLALGKKGVIVNVGRGRIIDEEEMVRCLMEREIAGAGLDVFQNEPDVPTDLIALDNAVLSPHRAAHTEETLLALSELVIGNLEAFFSNKPLLTPVILDE